MLQIIQENTYFIVSFPGKTMLKKLFQNTARISNFGHNSPEWLVGFFSDLTAF